MSGIKIVSALKEALPYIVKFQKKVFVIKFSGKLVDSEKILEGICEDIVLLEMVGIKPIVVHGGGQQIDVELKKQKISWKKVDGLRITDEKILKVVEKVFAQLNHRVAQLIRKHGGKAYTLEGIENSVIHAKKKQSKIDLGLVGEVEHIDSTILHSLLDEHFIPIISCLGKHGEQTLNINGDEVALAVARAMNAEKLMILSDVPGILKNPQDKKSLISKISIKEIKNLEKKGIISGGMIPKVKVCVEALNSNVGKTHLIDGKEHSLLLEVFTDKGTGTMIVK